MNLIIESQYFSPVILFKNSIDISNIEFDVYDRFQKMSFRNRMVIVGADGPIILSVPLLQGRNQRRPAKEVQIDNSRDWQGQHWKTIVSCYNRSPWFEYYRDGLEQLYLEKSDWLVDWNLNCWDWITRQLSLRIPAQFTTSYQPNYDPAHYLNWRNRLIPKSIFQDFPNPVRYRQVFEERTGFIPHCSILDLLFCEGKNALPLLRTDQ